MNRKLILAGVLGFGMVGAAAPATFAKEKPAAAKAEKEYDEQIKYADLPRPVKEAVDKERGKNEVKSFQHVMRDGKEFYRAVIDTRGDDKVVRFKPGGEVLSEQDVRDASDREVVAKHVVVGTGAKRQVQLHTGETGGEVVDFDRLPGEVKTQIGHRLNGDKIQQVVRYQHNGHTMFRADVGEGKYTRYIRVAEDGKLMGVRGDIDPGEAIPFDRTPGAVKSKIGALAKSGKVDEVIEYKRGGKTYYQAEVDDRDGKRTYFYTVDAEGKEVEGLPRI